MELDIPKRDRSDKTRDLLQTIVNEFPGGATATHLLGEIFNDPYQERLQDFHRSVARALNELYDKFEELDPGKLAENELFLSAFLKSTRIVSQNHLEEKRMALINVLLKAEAPKPIDDDFLELCLRYIDEFTFWHFLLLDFVHSPEEFAQKRTLLIPQSTMYSRIQLLENFIPEARSNSEFIKVALNDLEQKQLIISKDLTVTGHMRDVIKGTTTEFGKKFIAAISSLE